MGTKSSHCRRITHQSSIFIPPDLSLRRLGVFHQSTYTHSRKRTFCPSESQKNIILQSQILHYLDRGTKKHARMTASNTGDFTLPPKASRLNDARGEYVCPVENCNNRRYKSTASCKQYVHVGFIHAPSRLFKFRTTKNTKT